MTVALAIAACSGRPGFEDKRAAFAPDAGAGTTEPPAVCGIHCSRDLKQVRDGCDGAETVVATCNADQGCGDGRCVDACVSAAMSQGSIGCDFWTVPPSTDSPESQRGGCFAAMVANTWDRGVNLSAEYGREALDISKSTYLVASDGMDAVYTLLEGPLPPGQVAIVFLSHDDSSPGTYMTPRRCPATPAVLVDPIVHTTAKTRAFRIKTDTPVSAYSIAPYGGAESYCPTATLLLPTTSWTKNHIAVNSFDFRNDPTYANYMDATLQIIANDDDTEVSIRPTVEILGSGKVSGTPAGTPQTWTLAKGQVLQFVQRKRLTGSPIEATKPVAVFGGSQCTNVPAAAPACEPGAGRPSDVDVLQCVLTCRAFAAVGRFYGSFERSSRRQNPHNR